METKVLFIKFIIYLTIKFYYIIKIKKIEFFFFYMINKINNLPIHPRICTRTRTRTRTQTMSTENGPAEVVPTVHYPSDELFHLGNCVMKIRMMEQPDLNYWTGNGRKPKQCHRLHLALFTDLPYYWDKVIVRRRKAPESHICDLYARVNIMFKKNVDCYGNKVPWIVDRPIEHSAFERLDWTLDTSTGRLVDDSEDFTRDVTLSRLG